MKPFYLLFWMLIVGVIAPAVGCVSKSKYLSALQASEQNASAKAMTNLDLQDAYTANVQQQVVISSLEDKIQRLRQDNQSLADRSISETQSMSDRMREAQSHIYLLNQANDSLTTELSSYVEPLTRQQQFLSRYANRIQFAMADAPAGEFALQENADQLVLSLNDKLLFKNDNAKLTPYGDALLGNLASALGGESRVAIQVVAYPLKQSPGTMSAWKEASSRAVVVSSAMVEGHGLAPKLVSAIAREGELVVIDGGEAQARNKDKIFIEVSYQPEQTF